MIVHHYIYIKTCFLLMEIICLLVLRAQSGLFQQMFMYQYNVSKINSLIWSHGLLRRFMQGERDVVHEPF